MSRLYRPAKFDLALRVALLFIFVLAVEWPGGPLVTLGPQQTIATRNSKAGVHTRLTDEGAPWKIQRNLQQVREMGAPWIVEFFPWAYIEYSKNAFDWWHTDQVIDHARAQGLKVIARLGLVPAWARPDPLDQETTFNFIDPDHYDDFGDFVQAFVERYKKKFLGEYNIALDPSALVFRLTAGEKQLVMIAPALYRNPSILILDEPTSSLALNEIENCISSPERFA